MYIKDRHGWERLVYDMLYPGILGSMIYGFADECLGDKFNVFVFFIKLCILFFYCLDYLHLCQDLLLQKSEYRAITPRNVWLDAAIAIFFGVTYLTVLCGEFKISVGSLFLLSLATLCYVPRSDLHRLTYKISLGVLLCIVLVFGFCSVVWDIGEVCFLVFSIICTGWYFFHVFWISEWSKNRNKIAPR